MSRIAEYEEGAETENGQQEAVAGNSKVSSAESPSAAGCREDEFSPVSLPLYAPPNIAEKA